LTEERPKPNIRVAYRILAVPVAALMWFFVVNLGPALLGAPEFNLRVAVAIAMAAACAYLAVVCSLAALRGRVPPWLGGR